MKRQEGLGADQAYCKPVTLLRVSQKENRNE